MRPTPFEILAFDLAEVRYALPLDSVREVVRAVAIGPMPDGPALIEGVVNLRGVPIAVFDLRRRLGLPGKPVALTDHLIFSNVTSNVAERMLAVRVDRATAVRRVEPGTLEVAERTRPGAGYVRALPEDLLLIDDLGQLAGDAVLAALDQIAAPARPSHESPTSTEAH